MEERITLSTRETYIVSTKDLKKFYITMALSQYRLTCKPDHDEDKLLKHLHKNLKRMLKESLISLNNDPNNLNLHTIKNHFEHHYCNLCRILKINELN